MPLQKIGKMLLKNSYPDVASLGAPDGSTVYMHVFIIWGGEHEAKEAFVYEKVT